MKKSIFAIVAAIMVTTSVGACPAWECQLMIDDYSCGGVHGSCQSQYDENTQYNQFIYCPYCGHEMWDCVCGTDQSYICQEENYGYQESSGCNYDYQETYVEPSCSYICQDYGYGESMSHWANVRDECGNIIGQIGCGANVEVIGVDVNNPDRVMVFDASTGLYGSVLSECVYGGYEWDGTGDNGAYNAYNGYSGEACSYNSGYVDDGCSGCYGYVETCTPCAAVRYAESITIIKYYDAIFGGCR